MQNAHNIEGVWPLSISPDSEKMQKALIPGYGQSVTRGRICALPLASPTFLT